MRISNMGCKLFNTRSSKKLAWNAVRPRFGLVLVLTTVFTGGCGQDGIKTYTVPKEVPARTDSPGLAAPSGVTPLKWKLPTGWQEVPPSSMRVASFKITGADGHDLWGEV